MKTYLGIDQSLRNTGVVFVDESGEIVHQQRISPDSLRDAPRLAFIRGVLTTLVQEYQPVMAAYEGYSFDSVNRSFSLGELGGVVQLVLFDAEIPYHVIPPSTLKHFVTGHGDAKKEKMLRSTREKWGVDFGDEDDICDAHGLARLVHALNHSASLTVRHELEVVRDLLKPDDKLPAKTARKSRTTIAV